jgi:hypothetical protein
LTYEPGLKSASDSDTNTDAFKAAVNAAAAADVTIAVLGIDGTIEYEGADRSSVSLPLGQQLLLKAAAAARQRVARARLNVADSLSKAGAGAGMVTGGLVVVLTNGGPVSFDWLASAAPSERLAVLESFEGGQSGGQAVAETLFGLANPSGALPYSIYAENATLTSAAYTLPLEDFGMRPDPTRSPPYPGRTYRFSVAPVLFGFGAGLSYTTFTLEWSQMPPRHAPTSQVHSPGVPHSVRVTNTGSVAGGKVIQAFVTLAPSTVSASLEVPPPPLRSLYGLHKVFLLPGQAQDVVFSTESRAGAVPFATTLRDGRRFILPGRALITVGGTQKELPVITHNLVILGDAFEV